MWLVAPGIRSVSCPSAQQNRSGSSPVVGPAGPAWAQSPRNAESASWSPSRGSQVVSRSYKDASRASSLGGNGSVDPRGQQLGTPPGVHVTTALAPPLRPVPTYKQTPSALGFLTRGCNWQLPGAKRNPHCVAFGLQSIYNCNNKFDLVANVFKSGNFILEKKNPDFWLLLKKKTIVFFAHITQSKKWGSGAPTGHLGTQVPSASWLCYLLGLHSF